MPKVQIFKRPDGKLSIRYPDFSKKNLGETDEEFIERTSAKPRTYPELQGAEEFILDSSELPAVRKDRGKWRLNAGGKVFVDNSIQSPDEHRNVLINSVKAKLKGLGFTDEEADAFNDR
jgi:hypothetical protein